MRQIASRPALVEETNDEDDLDYDGICDFERFNGQGYEKQNSHLGSPTQAEIPVTWRGLSGGLFQRSLFLKEDCARLRNSKSKLGRMLMKKLNTYGKSMQRSHC